MKKDCFKIASVFVGTIIGAGFASGREIVRFFGSFWYFTFPLTVIAGFLFFYFAYVMLETGRKNSGLNTVSLSKKIFGRFYGVVNVLMILAYTVTVAAMFSANVSLSKMILPNFPTFIVPVLSAVLCVVVVAGGLKRLGDVNFVITPLIVALMIFLCVRFIIQNHSNAISIVNGSGALCGLYGVAFMLLYVFMNMQLSSEVMIMSGQHKDKKTVKYASVLGGFFIGFCIVLVMTSALLGGYKILTSDMPVVEMALSMGGWAPYVYAVIMEGAIFSTLIAGAFLVSDWLATKIKNRVLSAVIVVAVGYAMSFIGFSRIVNVLYPVTGMIGAIYVISVTVYYYRQKIAEKSGKGTKTFVTLEKAEQSAVSANVSVEAKQILINDVTEIKSGESFKDGEKN